MARKERFGGPEAEPTPTLSIAQMESDCSSAIESTPLPGATVGEARMSAGARAGHTVSMSGTQELLKNSSGTIVTTVYPAGPRGLWDRSLRAWFAAAVGSREWWVDVESAEAPWVVIRARFSAEHEAREFANKMVSGRIQLPHTPALWRRRVGWSAVSAPSD